ncbi:MAG: hypothetical protein ABI216_18370 [Devosia sp.]
MCKKELRQEQEVFDGESVVDEATHWAEALLQRTYRGPGDTIEAASYRAEQKYGVPAQTFWALRYRRPKDILASVYRTLGAAYEAECGRQEAKLRHELELAKALQGSASLDAAISEAETTLGIAPGGIEERAVR